MFTAFFNKRFKHILLMYLLAMMASWHGFAIVDLRMDLFESRMLLLHDHAGVAATTDRLDPQLSEFADRRRLICSGVSP
jgi:hypothetical protein